MIQPFFIPGIQECIKRSLLGEVPTRYMYILLYIQRHTVLLSIAGPCENEGEK
jgi:hypothetical protein